jgi:hypothetical protein
MTLPSVRREVPGLICPAVMRAYKVTAVEAQPPAAGAGQPASWGGRAWKTATDGDKPCKSWFNCNSFVNEVRTMALEGHLQELSEKHRKLQEMIETEMSHPDWDEVRVSALKKEKLRIKDELERLRSCVH